MALVKRSQLQLGKLYKFSQESNIVGTFVKRHDGGIFFDCEDSGFLTRSEEEEVKGLVGFFDDDTLSEFIEVENN